ncbi:MAG: hypothetical protein AAGA66_00330 [Bacteroidota bacterium]
MRKKITTYVLYSLILLTLVIYNNITKNEAELYKTDYQKILKASKSIERFEKLYAKEDSIIALSNRISELTKADGKED